MRIAVRTLGCRQNQYESDALEESLRCSGQTVVGFHETADLVIINTCSVTKEADADSRQMIRQAVRQSPSARVVVTGCYAQMAAGAIASIPGVDLVTGNAEKTRLLELIEGLPGGGPPQIAVGDIQQVRSFEPLPPPLRASRSRAFLKIQDGCNYRCSFCIIPETRGPNRSQSFDAALRDAKALAEAGYPEIVLTGTHLGTYGRDLPIRRSVAGLVAAMLETAAPARIRLSSLDPHEVGDDLIGLLARARTLCRHLHLPLQSGDDRVLKLMRRAYVAEQFRRLVEWVAADVPGIAIGVDVIVGFPGEGDTEFENTYRLLEGLPVAYLHVFSYSRRDGTVAASLPDQVPKAVRAARSAALRSLGRKKWHAFRCGLIGQPLAGVVLERKDVGSGRLEALTDNYVSVTFDAAGVEVGRMVRLMIDDVTERETLGRVLGRYPSGEPVGDRWTRG